MVNKDVIARRYLTLKLNRDRRRFSDLSIKVYIDDLKAWLAKQVKRTKKKGGLGR